MAEGEATEQDVYFGELVGFLQDSKVSVQRLAAEGLLEQTTSIDFIEYCQGKPRAVARALLRLAERAEDLTAKNKEGGDEAKKDRVATLEKMEAAAAGAAALKALVNLSASPSVCAELVDMNAARRCCEALQGGWLEGRTDLAHWHAMLLANLSTGEAGQKALCKEEGRLRFLFAAFVAKSRPPPRDGFDDPMLCLGKVLNNVCAIKEGRQIFGVGEAGASSVSMLAAETADRQRRPDIVSAFRNLCTDQECHDAIVGTDLLARFARFLYPWEKADPTRRTDLPAELQEVLQADGAALTGDVSVRHAAVQSILGLCLSKKGRAYLRECGCYELLRAWHLEEADDETRQALESVVPLVSQTDEELETAGLLPAEEEPETPAAQGYNNSEQAPEAPVQAGEPKLSSEPAERSTLADS